MFGKAYLLKEHLLFFQSSYLCYTDEPSIGKLILHI